MGQRGSRAAWVTTKNPHLLRASPPQIHPYRRRQKHRKKTRPCGKVRQIHSSFEKNLVSQPCSLLQRRISCNCPRTNSRCSWHSFLVSYTQAATSGATRFKERGRIHPT